MQLRLILHKCKWEVRYLQAGSSTGWSQWEPLDRQQALTSIEQGWSFEIF